MDQDRPRCVQASTRPRPGGGERGQACPRPRRTSTGAWPIPTRGHPGRGLGPCTRRTQARGLGPAWSGSGSGYFPAFPRHFPGCFSQSTSIHELFAQSGLFVRLIERLRWIRKSLSLIRDYPILFLA